MLPDEVITESARNLYKFDPVLGSLFVLVLALVLIAFAYRERQHGLEKKAFETRIAAGDEALRAERAAHDATRERMIERIDMVAKIGEDSRRSTDAAVETLATAVEIIKDRRRG